MHDLLAGHLNIIKARQVAVLCSNTNMLDSLNHAIRCNCLQDASSQGNERQLASRLAAFAAYEQLHQGNVCNAIAIVSKFCPEVLQV
jgi:hypothetical protein